MSYPVASCCSLSFAAVLYAFGRFHSMAPLVDVDAGTLKNLKFGVPAEPFWGPIRSIGASLGPQNGSAGSSFLKQRARARARALLNR